MSFIDSIKSWLSGNKDTVNNAVDKGGEFLKDKAPQHGDKIDTAREKFDGVFNKESEPLSPHDGYGSAKTEDKPDLSEANPVVPAEEESSDSEGVGEDSLVTKKADKATVISDTTVGSASNYEESTEDLVDKGVEDVSADSSEEKTETAPDFTIDEDFPQRSDINPESPEGSTEISEEQDLDLGSTAEPDLKKDKTTEDAPAQVGGVEGSEGDSNVVSDDVEPRTDIAAPPALLSAEDSFYTPDPEDNSVEDSEDTPDAVSEGVGSHTDEVIPSATQSTDDSSETLTYNDAEESKESSDVISEDVEAGSPALLSTEDSPENPTSGDDVKDNVLSEAPTPEAPSESPVQVEEDVNSAIEEEDLIDPKNNALTGFVEDDNKAEGSVEGSDLVNTEVTGFSLKEPDEDFSLTDNTLKETIADKVEDSDSSKTLGDLLDEDNRE